MRRVKSSDRYCDTLGHLPAAAAPSQKDPETRPLYADNQHPDISCARHPFIDSDRLGAAASIARQSQAAEPAPDGIHNAAQPSKAQAFAMKLHAPAMVFSMNKCPATAMR